MYYLSLFASNFPVESTGKYCDSIFIIASLFTYDNNIIVHLYCIEINVGIHNS